MNKEIQQTMFSSKTDQHFTPESFYAKLHKKYGFTLDPCACRKSAKCAKFYTKEDDGLNQDWGSEIIFMNPPYGRGLYTWMDKLYQETRKPHTIGVALVPARTDTKWFKIAWDHASRIFFIHGRLKFENNDKNAPFPSALIEFDWRVSREGDGLMYFNTSSQKWLHQRSITLVDKNLERLA
jgi:site-specific DNA-methyltransferase (adenine-specific)